MTVSPRKPRRVSLLAFSLLLGIGAAALLWSRRSAVLVENGVLYGVANGQELWLDVYRAYGAATLRPAVIFIHGGGWTSGSRDANTPFCRLLAQRGYVAFAISYRLTTDTDNRYPAQRDDAQRAVRWIRAHAGRYGVNPARIGAFGHSAGGHLAALLGVCETRDNREASLARYSSRVQCVVDMCGPTDFRDPANPPLTAQGQHLLPKLFGKTREEAPMLYRDASPVAFVSPQSAPFLLVHGTDDDLVPLAQSQRLYAALRAAGVEATLLELPNDGHLFNRPENQRKLIAEALAFFDRHLK